MILHPAVECAELVPADPGHGHGMLPPPDPHYSVISFMQDRAPEEQVSNIYM